MTPNPSLKRDCHRQGTWPASRSLSSFASRAKRLPGVSPSAQTLAVTDLPRHYRESSNSAFRMRLLVALSLLVPLTASAGSIYLCKSYGGGTFWSSAHCGTQKATIERIVSVPDNMPFEQQVQLGNQAVAEAAKLTAPPPQTTTQRSSQTVTRRQIADQCAALDEQIRHLDSMARQPQSASAQDQISQRRQAARDRQFQLRCR